MKQGEIKDIIISYLIGIPVGIIIQWLTPGNGVTFGETLWLGFCFMIGWNWEKIWVYLIKPLWPKVIKPLFDLIKPYFIEEK